MAMTSDDDERWAIDRSLRLEKQRAFLSRYRSNANVREACDAAGIARSTLYSWRRREAGFAEAMDEAQAMAVDRLESAAWDRALNGHVEPVFHNGRIVGHVNRPSDRLLQHLLEANRPEKFRANPKPPPTSAADHPLSEPALRATLENDRALEAAETLAEVLASASDAVSDGALVEGPNSDDILTP